MWECLEFTIANAEIAGSRSTNNPICKSLHERLMGQVEKFIAADKASDDDEAWLDQYENHLYTAPQDDEE